MDTSEHRSGIYLRISDDKEGLELGVGRQQEDCLSLSDRLGRVAYKIYKDNDISASTRSRRTRPDYQQLLADARAGLIDTIIAYTTSRPTRKPRENEDLIELAEQYGIQFYYVASPSFDLNTANGRLVAPMLAATDASQAEITAELISRKKLEKAVEGEYMGGARAYGFEGPIKDEKTGRYLSHDGLGGGEGTFWLAHAQALAGDVEAATATFERALAAINDVSLLAEAIDPGNGETIGNFPQTFSHTGLINAAWAITQAQQRADSLSARG